MKIGIPKEIKQKLFISFCIALSTCGCAEPQIISFTATPIEAGREDSIKLSWKVDHALKVSLYVSGFSNKSVSDSGSLVISPPLAAKFEETIRQFSLHAEGFGHPADATTRVHVRADTQIVNESNSQGVGLYGPEGVLDAAMKAVISCDFALYDKAIKKNAQWQKTSYYLENYNVFENFPLSIGPDGTALEWAALSDSLKQFQFLIQHPLLWHPGLQRINEKAMKSLYDRVLMDYLDPLQRYRNSRDSSRADIVGILTDSGADVNFADELFGYTPIFSAADDGNISVAEILVRHGATVNTFAKDGQTPLSRSIEANRFTMATWLISHGASPSSALVDLADKGTPDQIKFVVEKGADVNTSDGTPLLMALHSGKLINAKLLVGMGASVNHRDPLSGETALRAAVSADAIKWLFSVGATPSANDKAELLISAVNRQDAESVDLLLNKGYNANVTNFALQSPLHLAILKRNSIIAMMLVRHGASLRAKDMYDRSIYCYADCAKMSEILDACERAGAVIPCLRGTPCP